MEGSSINGLRKGTWSAEEDSLLRQCIDKYGQGKWLLSPQKAGLRKGAWTAEEDSLLRKCIDKYGEGKWRLVPLRAGLNRCRKSCRLRWLNYLKPDIKKDKFSSDEVDLLLRLHKLLGNRWSLIAGRLPGRTANDVKNFWNTHLSKKYETFSRTKMKKRNITSPTTEVQRTEIVKPQHRSFSIDNGLPKGDVIPPCFGVNNNNVGENSNNHDFVNNLTDEDNMWLESLLEDTQATDVFEYVVGPEATDTNKEPTLTFDVEHLWRLFHEDTVELN